MRIVLVLLAAACLVAPAFAIGPSPFIGANLQVNSPTGKFSQTDITSKEGGAKTGVGGEVDVGLGSGMGELYAGYRFGKNDVKASYALIPGVTANGKWDLNRYVIGARVRLLGALPISPTVGGGVTLGKVKRTLDVSVDSVHVGTTESANKVGWFLEAGAQLRMPSTPVTVLADIQYHRFNANITSTPLTGTYDISFFTFQAGVRFSLM